MLNRFLFFFFKIFVILTFQITLTSCEKIKVDSNNVPLSNKQSYFPEKMFSKFETKAETVEKPYPHPKVTHVLIENQYDTIVSSYFSEYLYIFKEPLLFQYGNDKEVYRFTKLNSFTSDIVVRIESTKSVKKIFWKEFSKSEDLQPDKLILNKERVFSNKEWDELIANIDKINFWNIYPNNNHSGLDGSSWLLEGLKDGKYYAVQYWSPKDKDFINVCESFVSKTDIKLR